MERFPSLAVPKSAIMLKHLVIQFPFYYLGQAVAYGRLKTKHIVKLLVINVITCERWSLTRF